MSSRRLWARSSAKSGLRHTMSLSAGKSGLAVSGDSRRAVASLESGFSTRPTTTASASCRWRLSWRCSRRSKPSRRQVPSTVMRSPRSPTATPPLRKVRKLLDDMIGEHGEVGDGLLAYPGSLAPGLPEEHGGFADPVGARSMLNAMGIRYGNTLPACIPPFTTITQQIPLVRSVEHR